MSERKAVVWFSEEPQPNTFFFGSPFRSRIFLANTVLLVGMCFLSGLMIWNYSEAFKHFPSWLLCYFVFGVVYPYFYALRGHRKIREHYRSGKLSLQEVETPVNDLLELADRALNWGLMNCIFLFGGLLLTVYLWKQH